jgi:hypothetical protein
VAFEQHPLNARLRLGKQAFSLAGRVAGAVIGRAHQRCVPSNLNELLSFFMALPVTSRDVLADDVKLLIGWVSEAAALERRLDVGETVNRSSAFRSVPGFGGPTDLTALKAAYRITTPPLTSPGYCGLVLTMMEEEQEVAVLLINRLFRLPTILREPVGVMTDVITTGALLFGIGTEAIGAAIKAVSAAYERARGSGIPLITCGQSMAGGLAQFQIAALQSSFANEQGLAGFLTFNAAHAAISIERLSLEPEMIPGINFSKDRDPGVGPHSLLPNRAGLQIYIHADGTGSFTPRGTRLSAFLHPWEHFLRSFDRVCLSEVLAELKLLRP